MNFKRLRIIQTFSLGLFISFFLATSLHAEIVRVCLIKNVEDVVISARGNYHILNLENLETLEEGSTFNKARILYSSPLLHIGQRSYQTKSIRIVSSRDISVYFNQERKRYRGALDIFVNKDSNLIVVNRLGLDDYVKGVLYHEVTDQWPIEAIKAQAVAVRSYTLYQLARTFNDKYDVRSDIYSQVYGGLSAERVRTIDAVSQTKGEVLMYKGEILPAYYHSNCGDHTENVSELWNLDLPPLKGVVCEYSKEGKNYEWKKNFRSKDVEEKLSLKGYQINNIENINVTERNESGRIRWLEIKSKEGKVLQISGKDFREILGPNEIKSNSYDIVMQGYYFDVLGKGWGHGVGMSQWGAFVMANKGKLHNEILSYYYPGTELVKKEEEN